MSDNNYRLLVETQYPSRESHPETIIDATAPLDVITAALHEFTKFANYGLYRIAVERAKHA